MGANQSYRIPGPNKTVYEGQCNQQGQPHGRGKIKYGQKSYFEGIFQNGAPFNGKFHYEGGDSYQGQIKNNKPEGEGIWKDRTGEYQGQFNNGQFINGTIKYTQGHQYTGYLINGLKEGENGYYLFNDGDKFVGKFYRNQFKNGVYTTKDGSIYSGQFENGLKHGFGELNIKNILSYKGFFKHDKFDGQGQLINIEKNYEYKGSFINNKKHGRGKLIDKTTNSIYTGQFKNNQKHGDGVYYFGKRQYKGFFQNGKFNGIGKLIYSNGDYYTGEFKDNKKHGLGQLYLQSINQTYKGEFIDDMISGKGIITYQNGDKYQGLFLNNKKHGKGTYTRKNGEILKGEWVYDEKNGMFEQINPQTRTQTVGIYENNQRQGEFLITCGGKTTPEHWIRGVKQYKPDN